jgi:hypothetical protein
MRSTDPFAVSFGVTRKQRLLCIQTPSVSGRRVQRNCVKRGEPVSSANECDVRPHEVVSRHVKRTSQRNNY